MLVDELLIGDPVDELAPEKVETVTLLVEIVVASVEILLVVESLDGLIESLEIAL